MTYERVTFLFSLPRSGMRIHDHPELHKLQRLYIRYAHAHQGNEL